MAGAVFGRALLASGGSLLALGGATALVSGVTTTVATNVIKSRMRKTAVACNVCHGRKTIRCNICRGKRVISYEPLPAKDAFLTTAGSACACPMCSCSGLQVCSNCLGEGIVYPAKGDRVRGAQLQQWEELDGPSPPVPSTPPTPQQPALA